MTIRQTIAEHWDDLSPAAHEWARRTGRVDLTRWDLSEVGYHYDTVTADTLEAALDLAEAGVDPDVYDTSEGTVYVEVHARNPITGEEGWRTVVLSPPEPDCWDDQTHEWQSPYSVLGGVRENPGVWGHGGGLIIREVCRHCGTYRITDTWAQCRDTGAQGLTEVTYEEADDASHAWVAEMAAAAEPE